MSIHLVISRLSQMSCKYLATSIIALPKILNKHAFATVKLDDAAPVVKKKKTTPVPRITLIAPGDQLSVTTLEDAQKISRRRDLKLVKIVDLDSKTERPVYKLMTGAEYFAEDLKRREHRKASKNETAIKGEKLLTLSTRITDHDLAARVKNISRWVRKQYEVRVVINGDASNMQGAEVVYTKLEDQLKAESRFLQKRVKGSDIRFQILPPKRDQSTNDGKNL